MPAFKMQVKSLNSLKALRNAVEKNNGLKEAFKESMNTPLTIVKERFSKLKWTNEPILVHNAATLEEINDCSRLLQVVDPDVKYEDPTTWSSKLFQTFVENHSLKRHYMYQVLFLIIFLNHMYYSVNFHVQSRMSNKPHTEAGLDINICRFLEVHTFKP